MSTINGVSREASGSVFAIGLALALAVGCSAPEPRGGASAARARQALETTGSVIVSVLLVEPAQSGQSVADAQADVRAELAGIGAEVLHDFVTSPGMSIRLESTAALDALVNHPSVDRFDVSPAGGTSLNDSRAIVGANQAFAAGLTGAGLRVAILDTGIQTEHPDLAPDLVAEACVCNTEFPGDPCCPSGGNLEVGPGTAEDDDGHGTHVSGIVTSTGTIAPRGIAPDADIIAVRMMNSGLFETTDDITGALEWLFLNHPEVDVVNMSLETNDRYPEQCDQPSADYTPDAALVNLANAVQALRDEGILSVVAAGNSNDKILMSAPGCLSNVVTVGNTQKNNTVAVDTNSNAGLELWAPGTDIVSTFPFNGDSPLSGTSQSSPHVAAAVAILLQDEPALDPDEIVECLTTSPTQITDPANGITRPLLHIPSALTACGAPSCNTATYEAETMFHSTGGSTPGGWNIWSNGFISTTHNFTAGPARLTVRAQGQQAQGVLPHMVVTVGGTPVGNVNVTTGSYNNYVFNFVAPGGSREIRVIFDNDFYAPPADRNLLVDRVTVDCTPASSLGASLHVTTTWQTGYCMGVQLTNTGSAPTSGWQVVLNLQGTTIYNRWNANFSSLTGTTTLTPTAPWNAIINPGQTIQSATIGFCANRPQGSNALATLVSATSF